MNWKKRYEIIEVGDFVKLLYIDEADKNNGVNEGDIGRTFIVKTVSKVSEEQPHYEKSGGTIFNMEPDLETGHRGTFYLKQVEKI